MFHPYSFLTIDVSDLHDDTQRSCGVYVARAQHRGRVTLSVRYPLCSSAVLNIGRTERTVHERWFAPDKLRRIEEYMRQRKRKQRLASIDAISVWRVLPDQDRERPLYMLFTLAAGGFPALQREQGARRLDEGKVSSCTIELKEIAALKERDIDVAFEFEDWRTLDRLHRLYHLLKDRDGAIRVGLQLIDHLAEGRRERYGNTDRGTPVLVSIDCPGIGSKSLREHKLPELAGLIAP